MTVAGVDTELAVSVAGVDPGLAVTVAGVDTGLAVTVAGVDTGLAVSQSRRPVHVDTTRDSQSRRQSIAPGRPSLFRHRPIVEYRFSTYS